MWPTAVEVAMRAGDDRAVGGLLDLVDSDQGRSVVPRAITAHRTRIAGLLARGETPERVEQLLREALEGVTTWGAAPYRARTEAELGAWLISQGRPDEGGPLLDRGRATLAGLGARAWLAETETAGVLGP